MLGGGRNPKRSTGTDRPIEVDDAWRAATQFLDIGESSLVASIDGPVVDIMLRLGSHVLGSPLEFSAPGHDELFAGAASREAAHIKFSAREDVRGPRGETHGALRMRDIRARPPLGQGERRVFSDIAGALAAHLDAENAIGRVDHVTRLPNREQFIADMERLALEKDDGRSDLLVLVTLADAMHFNAILRALGHGFADDFVRTGAAILQGELPAGTRLYHASVLSFAFLMEDAPGTDAPALVRSLVRTFASPIMCHKLPVAARVGVGFTHLRHGHAKPADALRATLAAAQDSRATEKGWANYDKATDDAHLRAFALLTDLGLALRDRGQLTLNYQPRIDLKSGECHSAEALLRWMHPTLGSISPGEFIPLAETTAMIAPLTDWVLRAAVDQAANWRKRGLDLTLSINVSPNNLRESDFVDRVNGILDEHGLGPEHIELELTESALAPNDATARLQLQRLRDSGIDISIDDFGAGYSNLRYLTSLPASTLKIDQSFVRPLDTQPKNQLLVKTMIDMAHDLGYQVVCEGIETQASYGLVSGWGCDQGQGYFMSRPLVRDAFEGWLRKR